MAVSTTSTGSNIDVNSIVSQLMAIERKPAALLDKKEVAYQAKLSAYGSLKSALASFQTAMSGLNSVARFQALSATAADTTVLTASADSTAVPGSYTVQISQLAQTQTLAADGRTSSSAAIGAAVTTTLTFNFGTISGGSLTNGKYTGATFTPDATQATGTVTLNSTNNSLQGIRDAINAADIGVTATIVNDGGASPYRLVLASSATGASKSMKITVDGDATLQGLLAYDPGTGLPADQKLTQGSAAQNAELTVNGIAVSSASNTVTGAIQGVTLNPVKAGTTTLAVARDTTAVQSAATAFVSAYNNMNSTLASLTAYNATTKQSAVLLGDATVRSLQSQIRSALGSTLTGSGATLTLLSQIGITRQKDGTMVLDTAKLATATASNFSDIAGIFAAVGKPTDSLVNFVSLTANSTPGSYAVNVTTLATQGSETGGATAAGLTINAGVNDELLVVLDGVSATVTLPAGTYATAAALAAQVQSSINGTAAFIAAGDTVNVTETAGVISITSDRYGSGSTVSITGNGLLNLLGAAPVTTAGVDAAGTIGGLGATGAGQNLTGVTGGVTEGLKIQIVGGATGARGTLHFSRGYADQLYTLATSFLDATTGAITSRTDGISKSITDIGKQRDAFNLRMVEVEARYRAQFIALDNMLSSMTQTSLFLTQQLTNLSNNN